MLHLTAVAQQGHTILIPIAVVVELEADPVILVSEVFSSGDCHSFFAIHSSNTASTRRGLSKPAGPGIRPFANMRSTQIMCALKFSFGGAEQPFRLTQMSRFPLSVTWKAQ